MLQWRSIRRHELWMRGLASRSVQRSRLARLFVEAGLQNVRVGEVSIETRLEDFAHFWEPFIGGPGPAPGYVASLGERQRERLRSKLQESLESEADGSIPLSA